MLQPYLEERQRKVKLLLETAERYLPDPRGSRTVGGSGFTREHRQSCGDCLANGFVSRDCDSCGGRGFTEQHERDPYDTGEGVAVMGGAEERKRQNERRRDAVLAQLERDAAARDGSFEHERFAWESERQRMHREGSYRELDRCLVALMVKSAHVARAVWLVYGPEKLRAASSFDRRLADLGIEWIARTMRGEIHVPGWAEQRVQAKSAKLQIIALAVEGKSVRQIAKVVGVRKAEVKRLIEQMNVVRPGS